MLKDGIKALGEEPRLGLHDGGQVDKKPNEIWQ